MTVLYDEPSPAFWLRLSILANDAEAAVRVSLLAVGRPSGSVGSPDPGPMFREMERLDAFVEPLLSQLRNEAHPSA